MKGELCGQRENARAMRTVEIDEGSLCEKRTIAVDEGFYAKGEFLRVEWTTGSLRFADWLLRLRDLEYNRVDVEGGGPSDALSSGEPA